MLRLGWFSTGRGPGSRNLLRSVMDRKISGDLDVEISFVFCNWSNEEEDNPRREQRKEFFDMVEGYGIPLVTVSWKEFMPELRENDEAAWRVEYGKALRASVEPYGFDLGILAGYMLWMDDETCREFDMLNLHPALPDGPKGTWQEVIWTLIKERAGRQGAMMHLCRHHLLRIPHQRKRVRSALEGAGRAPREEEHRRHREGAPPGPAAVQKDKGGRRREGAPADLRDHRRLRGRKGLDRGQEARGGREGPG